MLEELWQPVEGFPNYEISNYGRVVNVRTGYELKNWICGPGGRYLRVELSKDSLRRAFFLHRLVAREFFLQFNDSVEVRCKNGNYHDCTVANITIHQTETGYRRGAILIYGEGDGRSISSSD